MMNIFRNSRVAGIAGILCITLGMTACSLSDLVNAAPPTGNGSVPDPGAIQNEQGAFEQYQGAINRFRIATTGRVFTGNYVVLSGMIGDEFNAGKLSSSHTRNTVIDSRSMSESNPQVADGIDYVWRELNGVRIAAMTAIPALRKYAPNRPKDYQGHAYALWGMAELMLANLYCSGIPLSTVELEGSFTYAPGSTTQQVYEHAIKMFDSALVYSPDSAEVQNLAKVGKGWALLNLGKFTEAAQAVSGVPNDFVYKNLHSTDVPSQNRSAANFTYIFSTSPNVDDYGTISDREGGNGLPYRSNNDPRTISDSVGNPAPLTGGLTIFMPRRWGGPPKGGATPIIMASGVEARLIEAEAALRSDNASWLTTLNQLRNNGIQSVDTTWDGTTIVEIDTTWSPGIGAVLFTSIGQTLPGLPQLEDPQNEDARVDLLFTERAYWLFTTGRRHSDMRRLIRQYGRSEGEVFPRGDYPAGPLRQYGTDVNLPAPPSERTYNDRYTGCFDRQA